MSSAQHINTLQGLGPCIQWLLLLIAFGHRVPLKLSLIGTYGVRHYSSRGHKVSLTLSRTRSVPSPYFGTKCPFAITTYWDTECPFLLKPSRPRNVPFYYSLLRHKVSLTITSYCDTNCPLPLQLTRTQSFPCHYYLLGHKMSLANTASKDTECPFPL